jgi:glycosyltransferase involved in cell wall biosynthesis
MVSLVITNYNRIDNIKNIINNNQYFNEIVINDDCSNLDTYKKIESFCSNLENVKLFRNEKNVGAFYNKHIALTKSTNDWCILLDSDNMINENYLSTLEKIEWDENTIYLPSTFGKFNYKNIEGYTFDKIEDFLKDSYGPLMNAGNYFFNKKKYLEISEKWVDVIKYVEVFAINYLWVKNGGKLYVTPGLNYNHIKSNDSFYLAEQDRHKKIKKYITECIINNKDISREEILKING